MNEKEKKQQKTRDAINKLLLAGAATGSGTLISSPRAEAIDVTTVNTNITSIITNTNAAADVAWPIGAALMALTVIG